VRSLLEKENVKIGQERFAVLNLFSNVRDLIRHHPASSIQ
jgi:hypothetical protein